MMKKLYLKTFIFVMMGALMFGCAAKQPASICSPQDLSAKVQSGEYVQKVDNFLIILDRSESMTKTYKDQKKICMAKDIVSCMNETIPDLKLVGGMRAFGHGWVKVKVPGSETEHIYGMTDYSRAGLAQGLGTVQYAGGNTPMSYAIAAGIGDLKDAAGDIAVIIVSDGVATDECPVEAADNMTKAYDGRICIYTIQIGNDPNGKETLEKIAAASGCGFSVNADQINMGDFVMKVFLKKRPPEAPKAKVVEKLVLTGVLFDFDKATIKTDFIPILDEAVAFLNKYADKDVIVEGHTCSLGKEAYNMGLSLRRSQSVKNYLVTKGLDPDRLTCKGYGESRPVADNTTKDGRKKNRRVEFKVVEK